MGCDARLFGNGDWRWCKPAAGGLIVFKVDMAGDPLAMWLLLCDACTYA